MYCGAENCNAFLFSLVDLVAKASGKERTEIPVQFTAMKFYQFLNLVRPIIHFT